MQIVRLTEMPEKKRAELEKVMKDQNIPKPFPDFNSDGLRFTMEHLQDIGGAVCLLPLEYMAEYVDAITKNHIDENDTEFINRHRDSFKPEHHTPETFPNYNATSIGNIAYVALNCKDETLVKYCMDILDRYSDWYLTRLSKNIKAKA